MSSSLVQQTTVEECCHYKLSDIHIPARRRCSLWLVTATFRPMGSRATEGLCEGYRQRRWWWWHRSFLWEWTSGRQPGHLICWTQPWCLHTNTEMERIDQQQGEDWSSTRRGLIINYRERTDQQRGEDWSTGRGIITNNMERDRTDHQLQGEDWSTTGRGLIINNMERERTDQQQGEDWSSTTWRGRGLINNRERTDHQQHGEGEDWSTTGRGPNNTNRDKAEQQQGEDWPPTTGRGLITNSSIMHSFHSDFSF